MDLWDPDLCLGVRLVEIQTLSTVNEPKLDPVDKVYPCFSVRSSEKDHSNSARRLTIPPNEMLKPSSSGLVVSHSDKCPLFGKR